MANGQRIRVRLPPALVALAAALCLGVALYGATGRNPTPDADVGLAALRAAPSDASQATAADAAGLPPFAPFSGRDGSGRTLVIASAGDCDQLGDGFLASWCRAVASPDGPTLPEDASASANHLYFAVFARALLGGDYSACDWPAVGRWVEVSARVPDGPRACRESMAYLSRQGWFTVSDPATAKSFTVTLRS